MSKKLLSGPYLVWMAGFIVIPLILILYYGLTDKTGKVVGIKVVDGSEDLMVLTEKGILLRTAVDTIKTCGRSTQGVIVMRFKEEGDRVIALSLAEKEPEEDTAAQDQESAAPVEVPEEDLPAQE